ncbi:MAG: TPM domain-containing protein [Sphingomicrobium sp.]
MRLLLAASLVLSLAGCHRAQASVNPVVVHTAAGDIALTGRVVDRAGIIPDADELRLTKRLEDPEKDTTDQLVVVTLGGLNGGRIEDVGRALGDGWGIGRADVDNGVLLLVAPNDRKVRIEVGLGLEGLLSDQRATVIIKDMLPAFRGNRPAQAIELGVGEISSLLASDKQRPRRKMQKEAA